MSIISLWMVTGGRRPKLAQHKKEPKVMREYLREKFKKDATKSFKVLFKP